MKLFRPKRGESSNTRIYTIIQILITIILLCVCESTTLAASRLVVECFLDAVLV